MVFESTASNLLGATDTNGYSDIFIKTLSTGAITRVNTDYAGAQATGGAGTNAQFSADGTKVLFFSTATNLVPGDTNGVSDLFVKDLVTGSITRVNTDITGAQGTGGATVGNAAFSPDGTRVLFYSSATNLIGNDSNATQDAFIKTIAANPRIVDNPNLSTLTVKGYFTFTDTDSSDTHTVTAAAKAGNATATTLSLTSINDSNVSVAGVGKYDWTYSVSEATVHALTVGGTYSDKFTITIDDGHGVVATQDLTIDLLNVTW